MASTETNNTKLQQQLKDLTKCSICTETFTDPRILPCIHTFCMKCLEDVASKSDKKPAQNMPCPLCKRDFDIPLEGFDGIQKNFFMAKHIDIGMSVSRSLSRHLCDACLEDCNDPASETQVPSAEIFCRDCCIKLCANCLKIHRKSKLTISHKLETLENQPLPGQNQSKVDAQVCQEHESELLKIYCSSCKKVVCSFCYIESHQGHKWSDVETASEEFCNKIQNHILSLALKNKGLREKREEVSQANTDIIATMESLELEINQRKALLKETIDKHADLLLMEVEALRQEKLRLVQIEEEDIDLQIANEECYSLYCQEITTKGSAGDICRDEVQLNKRAIELQEMNESICQRHLQSFCSILTYSKLDEFLKDNCENIIGIIEDAESSTAAVHRQETAPLNIREEDKQSKADDQIYAGSVATTKAVEEASSRETGTNLLGEHEISDNLLQMEAPTEETTGVAAVGLLLPKKAEINNDVRASITREQPFRAVLTKDYLITGMAIIENELFIATAMWADIEVYDSVTLILKRTWTLPGLKCPEGMVACSELKCLYIFDATDRGKIYRVDRMGSILSAWFSGDKIVRLSVTPDSNVIIVFLRANKLKEYAPIRQNQLIQQVGLTSHTRYAVKLSNRNFLISKGGVGAGVFEVNIKGQEINSFKQLNWPEQLAVDNQGSVIVVDRGNRRVLLLNSKLEFKKQLISSEIGLFDPLAMVLDKSTGRLFVAVYDIDEDSWKIYVGSY